MTSPRQSVVDTGHGLRVEFSRSAQPAPPYSGRPHDDVPELDVRTVPHAIRQAAVFDAFDCVTPGASLDLIAPHDPVPLLWQLRDRAQGALHVRYLDRGPQTWRIRLTRS